MKKTFFTLATIISALMAATLAVGSAKAGVVYGNLGASGTDPISSVGTVNLATSFRAIGFIPLAPDLSLSSATLGINVDALGSADVRVDLYSAVVSGTNINPGTSLASVTQTLGPNINQAITFDFSGVPLTSGSNYFVVAQKIGGVGTAVWRQPNPTAAPVAQNGSGWNNLGIITSQNSTDGGTTWTYAGPGNARAISLSAVPEPSTWILAGFGVGAVATFREVQRRRRVSQRTA